MHRPLRSAATLPRALCPAPALPSPVGVDAILGPGPDGPPAAEPATPLEDGGGLRRARGCRHTRRRRGRGGRWTGRRRTSARAPKPIPTQPRNAGPAASASCCGSRGRTSPRLSPSMQHHAALREGEHRHLRLLHLRRRRRSPHSRTPSRRSTAARPRVRRMGRRAARAGPSSPACRAIDLQELAHRQLGSVAVSMMSPGSTYGTCPSPRWTTIRPISAREIRRRMAISAADGSPSINLIATTALPGVGADDAPRRRRLRSRARARARMPPRPTTEIWGCAPSNPRVSRTSATT